MDLMKFRTGNRLPRGFSHVNRSFFLQTGLDWPGEAHRHAGPPPVLDWCTPSTELICSPKQMFGFPFQEG